MAERPHLRVASEDGMTIAQHRRRDGWGTDDGRYAIDKFYTASTDGKRDHATVQVAIPASLMAEIDKLVQSARIPEYDTRQAFIRDAIVHRLKFADEHLKVIDATGRRRINQWINLATVKALRQEKSVREQILTELADALKEAEQTRDLTQIAQIFEAQEPIIRDFPPDQRERGLRILAQYRHYLEDGDG